MTEMPDVTKVTPGVMRTAVLAAQIPDGVRVDRFFYPPAGHTHADVLLAAHRIRVERGDYAIVSVHLADAIEQLVTRSRGSLSSDRAPKNPYTHAHPAEVQTPDE